MGSKTIWSWARRATLAIAVVIAVVGMGSVLTISLAGKLGDQALGLKTGSMRPVLNPGDLVLVHQVDPKSIHVGDIISFRRPNETNEIFTHRVHSIVYTSQGQVAFKTKGDANPISDPWTVVYSGPANEVVHVIRHGGVFLHIAQSRPAREAIAGSIFFIVLALLWPVIVGPSDRSATDRLVSTAGVA